MSDPLDIPRRRNPIRILLPLACGLAGLAPAQTTTPTVESRPSPVRDHRLFAGVDIKIFHNKEFQTVLDYSQHFASLENNPRTPIDVRTVNQARFETVTKIGRNPVSISNIETHRDHSLRHDAGARWAAQRAALDSFQSDEQGKFTGDIKDQPGVASGGPRNNRNNTQYNPTSNMDTRASAALDAEIQFQFDEQFFADDGQMESGPKTALVVQATVASPETITGAYAVAIARVRINDTLHDLILFSDLDPLVPTPRQIEIRKENLPIDLHVIKVDLHLFREGRELVSDQSPHQFPLTRDEARQYLTLAHTTDYRGRTVPAQPVWNLPPPALFATESSDQFDFPVRVGIDAQGHITRIDETSVLPPEIRALIAETIFVPALDHGVAIPSETIVNLHDFFR